MQTTTTLRAYIARVCKLQRNYEKGCHATLFLLYKVLLITSLIQVTLLYICNPGPSPGFFMPDTQFQEGNP
jgi:hypothetical protein